MVEFLPEFITIGVLILAGGAEAIHLLRTRKLASLAHLVPHADRLFGPISLRHLDCWPLECFAGD